MAFGGKLLRGIVVACKAGGVVAVKFGIKKAAYAAGAGVGMGTIAENSADLSLQFFEEICKHVSGGGAKREESALQPVPGALDPAAQMEMKQQIAETAQATPEQMTAEMGDAIAEVAPDLPAEMQDSLRAYAAILPERVRRTLRRAEDPSGRTIPEARQFRTVLDLAEVLPPPARFRPGECPVYNRELKRLLGVGTFGEVWEASKLGMAGRRVALKFCLGDERALEHEARLAQRLEHPGIVQLFEIHPRTSDVPLCLEYELVDGPDLAAWYLSRKLSDDERPKAVATTIASLAQILSVAHNHRSDDGRPEPIVHRDLKPGNILVAKTANGHALKITDFGIGGVVRAAEETRTETQRRTMAARAGSSYTVDAIRAYTPRYSPHEQIAGAAPDPRQDVHALGVIWYQMLRRDFSAPNPSGGAWKRKLRAEGVDDAYLELIESCLDTEACERPRDGAALAEAIRAAGSQQSAVAAPADSPAPSVVVPATPKVVTPAKPQLVEAHFPMTEAEAREVQAAAAKALGVPVVETLDLGKGVTLEMVLIPAGEFLMGGDQSPEEVARLADSKPEHFKEEHPRHMVRISQPFRVGKYPVTQAQWQAVVGNNPSRFAASAASPGVLQNLVRAISGSAPPPAAGFGNHPVEQVSWDDCHQFCQKLSRDTHRGFRFPTEAQWEYACRAGTPSPFHFGGTISTAQANYDGNYTYANGRKGEYQQKTMPVGRFPANAWGLHDLHGNVWEWCADWLSEYERGDAVDPTGAGSGSVRVLRGGSWYSYPRSCRSAFRGGRAPDWRSFRSGFRVASGPE